MLEPKFFEYFTDKKAKTKHAYEYIVLREDAPKDIKDEYMEMVYNQDERMKNNEFVLR